MFYCKCLFPILHHLVFTFANTYFHIPVVSHCPVHKELTSLLDSLLQLQRSLLLRHKDTRSLVCGGGRPAKQTEEDRVTESDDEEVPSDFDSNDDSDQHEEAEEGEEKGIGRKRRRRKRKCPWVSERCVCAMFVHISLFSPSLRGLVAMRTTYHTPTRPSRATKMRLLPSGTPKSGLPVGN